MPAVSASKYRVQAGWQDVPHLDEKTKQELLEATPPHLRDARTRGIPSLGSGAIYPIPLEDITCPPFAIPGFWRRGYALDVGWNKTAAVWGAQDPSDGVLYVTSEYYVGQRRPPEHAEAIKLRGDWMKGAIDPAARGRGQDDGKRLFDQYLLEGLKLVPANNAVEAGITMVWQLLSAGRLKFFSPCLHLQGEYGLYRRDERGKIVKENDHLLDAVRYLVMTWKTIAGLQPANTETYAGGFRPSNSKTGY